MTLKEVCQEYYNMVYQRCLYELYYNEDLAYEVTQQVFLILCLKWNILHHKNLKRWLMKTAEHKIKHAKADFTQSRNILSIESEEYIEPIIPHDLHEQILCDRVEKHISLYRQEILSQLNEREQQLVQYILEKKKYAEIAQLMEMSEGAVSMAVVRLKRKVDAIVKNITDNIL